MGPARTLLTIAVTVVVAGWLAHVPAPAPVDGGPAAGPAGTPSGRADAALRTARRCRGTTIAPGPAGEPLILTEPIGGGVTIRTVDLESIAAVLPSFQVEPLGFAGGLLYARASAGMSTDLLVAIELDTGTMTGMAPLAHAAQFLPGSGLLGSPAPNDG